MIHELKIPSEALKYVLFQRTTYIASLKLIKRLGLKGYPAILPYEKAVVLESLFRKSRIEKEYFEDLQSDYSTIKDVLPKECTRVLDIGCGIAGIDLFLDRHYNGSLELFLLDKTELESKISYMFKQKAAFYNSLSLAKTFLTSNGVAPERINLLEVNERNEIAIDGTVDLVVSLISWGYHYPISVYLERVYQLLRPGGVLILDVRKRTDGFEKIKERFGDYEVLSDSEKQSRIKTTKL